MTHRLLGSSTAALSVSVLGLMVAMSPAHAITVTMDGSDSGADSSFNSGLNWDNNAAPSPGNDYFTGGETLRTPAALASDTFLGDSLSIDSGGQMRISGPTGNTLTVNGLLMAGGTILQSAATANSTLNGSMDFTADSTLDVRALGRVLRIGAEIGGAGQISIISNALAGGLVNIFNGANNYTGNVLVNSGAILRQSGAGALSSAGSGIVTLNGTLQLQNSDAAINGLGGSGSVTVSSGAATSLTLDGDSGTSTFSGVIEDGVGTVSVTKTGGSTQVFSGANTYTGVTTVEEGTLVVGNDTALGTGSVTITNNGTGDGTLELSGTSIANGLTLVGRDNTSSHVDASAAGSQITGAVDLTNGGNTPDNFTITAQLGADLTLTSTGSIGDSDGASGALNLGGDGALNLEGGVTMSDDSDSINKVGSGTLTTSGSGAMTTGTFNVQEGSVNLGAALTTDGDVTVASGATLTQDGSLIDSASQSGNYDVEGAVDINGASASMNGLDGAGSIVNANGTPATLTFDGSGGGSFTGTLGNGVNDLNIVMSGAGTQSAGDIDAVAGTILATDGALNAGTISSSGGVTASGGDLTVSGAASTGSVTVETGSVVDFAGDLTSSGVTVSGGSLELSGAGNSIGGSVSVTGGNLIVQDSGALGGGSSVSLDGGKMSLNGEGTDMTISEVISLFGQPGVGAQLENVANANSIAELVLDEGGADETYSISSEGGTLTISDLDATGLSADGDTLILGGDSAAVGNAVTMDGSISNLSKTGDSEWTVNDLSSGGGTISSESGILTLADSANLTGNIVYDVLEAAELDATGIGGLAMDAGDQLQGGGLVTADVVAESGSVISVGDSTAAGQDLEITGAVDLAGTLALNVSGSMIDALLVGGELSLVDATLDLASSLTSSVYVFAEYGSLVGAGFATVVAGYTFDYMYGASDNQIALVKDMPTIPAPTPLALMGLGALVWGASRRGKKAAR